MTALRPSRFLFGWTSLSLLGLGVIGAITTSYLPKAVTADASLPIADNLTFATLYGGLFLFLLGLMVIIGYGLRFRKPGFTIEESRWALIRQATLVALGGTALLVLQGVRVLSWWDGILLIIALILVELSFHTRSLPS